ncbi:MAG: hypothetical protein BJ554DRAFT_2047, partial [Olpidium bornovanus]
EGPFSTPGRPAGTNDETPSPCALLPPHPRVPRFSTPRDDSPATSQLWRAPGLLCYQAKATALPARRGLPAATVSSPAALRPVGQGRRRRACHTPETDTLSWDRMTRGLQALFGDLPDASDVSATELFTALMAEPFQRRWRALAHGLGIDLVSQVRWYACRVLATSGYNVRVHYEGWPDEDDEWIQANSTRIRLIQGEEESKPATHVPQRKRKRLEDRNGGQILDFKEQNGSFDEPADADAEEESRGLSDVRETNGGAQVIEFNASDTAEHCRCALCKDDDPGILGGFVGPFWATVEDTSPDSKEKDVRSKTGFWVHLHCAKFSAEVYATGDGDLHNVVAAIYRGRKLVRVGN